MQVDERQPPSEVIDAAVTAPRSPDAAGVTGRDWADRWWSPLWLLLVADVVALVAAAALVGVTPAYTAVVVASSVFGLRMANRYHRVLLPSAFDRIGATTMSLASAALVAAAVTGTSSLEAARYAAAATVVLVVARAAAHALHRATVVRSPQRAIIVGTGPEGQELVTRLLDHPEYGIDPLGFVDTTPGPIDPSLPLGVLGELGTLLDVVRRLDVHRIILDTGSVSEGELLEVLDLASSLDVEISVLPTLARHLSTSIAVEGVAGATLLSYRPSRHQGVSWTVKRALDVAGALGMLLVSAPIWLLVAVAIKLDSRGPVLYKQTRVGRHGRSFTIYKFRSMQIDADAQKTRYLDLNEANGPYFKIRCDPRVTRVGRHIRRFSIDELPQVFNVLRGDMSLVGPRPALATEVAEYPDWFRRRLAVRPGLTGLWQVSGRFLLPFAEATRLDVSYVDHWSLALDLQILARTPAVVLGGRGAH